MAFIVYAITALVLLSLLVVYALAGGLALVWLRRAGPRALWLLAVTAVSLALDAVFLWSLPALDISYGPARDAWLILALLRGAMLVLVWCMGLLARSPRRGLALALTVLLASYVLLGGYLVDIFVVEPHDLRATRWTFQVPDRPADWEPLRIAHVTDTHVERWTRREAAVVEQVNAFQPHLILFTGDYLNLSYLGDETARRDFRRLVSELHAPLGMYATSGSVDGLDLPTLFNGPPVTVLDNEVHTVDWHGAPVHIIGVACTHDPVIDVPNLDRTLAQVPHDGGLRILLYHSPELIDAARDRGLHLFLAGHTHGGQVCLPFYGPLIAYPMYNPVNASGAFPLDDQGLGQMIVSRGTGMEGWVVPRVRWLCPPEVGLITITAPPTQ
ncbi:MAG: metallophosphoesterase family protein [Chloroflexi bacterium]|nr:metallophosphoesterase family protein [Chloroflexota bacterium]MBU1746679.1 metallophosphoesterase family protein [Chloroflexota bacterium]